MNKEEILKKHCANIHFERPDDTFSNVLEAMNEYADQRISEALNGQWVSVKDRLPKDRELVVVFMLYGTNDFSRWTGYRLNGEWMDCNGQLKLKSVTHWTNLPSPPLKP